MRAVLGCGKYIILGASAMGTRSAYRTREVQTYVGSTLLVAKEEVVHAAVFTCKRVNDKGDDLWNGLTLTVRLPLRPSF